MSNLTNTVNYELVIEDNLANVNLKADVFKYAKSENLLTLCYDNDDLEGV